MPEKKQFRLAFSLEIRDIRRKLLITLGILMLFRIAANIPVPGVDHAAWRPFSRPRAAQEAFWVF